MLLRTIQPFLHLRTIKKQQIRVKEAHREMSNPVLQHTNTAVAAFYPHSVNPSPYGDDLSVATLQVSVHVTCVK